MSVERRGQVIRVTTQLVNWQQEEPTDRGEGRLLFMNDKSRVSREAQARFREGLGVKLPGATRPSTDRSSALEIGNTGLMAQHSGASTARARFHFLLEQYAPLVGLKRLL